MPALHRIAVQNPRDGPHSTEREGGERRQTAIDFAVSIRIHFKLHEEKNSMKKTLTVMLALVALTLFAFGCKKEETINTTDTTATTDTAMSSTTSTTDTAMSGTTSATDTSQMTTGTTGTMSTTDTSMTGTSGTMSSNDTSGTGGTMNSTGGTTGTTSTTTTSKHKTTTTKKTH
jgi:hypothetical protein